MNTFIKVLILLLLLGSKGHSQETLNLFNPAYFETQRFAHRGGYFSGPENTIPTILTNLSKGVTSIEIDIRLTRDQKLILFHDETIERLLETDDNLSVSELSLEELRNIPFKNSKTNQRINTLAELLDTLSVFIPANDIKNFLLELDFKPHGETMEKAVEELLLLLEKYEKIYGARIYEHVFVSSFYPDVLKALYRKNRNIKKAFAINNNPAKNKIAARLALVLAPVVIRKYEVEIIEPNIFMVTDKFVRKWHRRGILINAYTANTKCEKNYLEQFQIAYTTNCPFGFCKGDPSDELGKPKEWWKECSRKAD